VVSGALIEHDHSAFGFVTNFPSTDYRSAGLHRWNFCDLSKTKIKPVPFLPRAINIWTFDRRHQYLWL